MALAKAEIDMHVPSFAESHTWPVGSDVNFCCGIGSVMFQMMSLSYDETQSTNFFCKKVRNFIVLNCLLFNQIQTLCCLCLKTRSVSDAALFVYRLKAKLSCLENFKVLSSVKV